MDLNVPSGDGAVTGAYFYLKHGRELRLSGTKKEGNLLLEERYDGKVTGILEISHPATAVARPRSFDRLWRRHLLPQVRAGDRDQRARVRVGRAR